MWKRNPSPARSRGYPARHPPGEEQQRPCEQRAETPSLLQSPALPTRLLIKRKRRRFRSFPKKARSLLGSCASPGIFFFLSADFPACLTQPGRPGGTLAESPC